MLSLWPDFTFQGGSFSFKALGRRIHVVSTPDVVREVFVDKAATFMSKTAQQRHALIPLVGDGLIVSDGEVWRQRRQVVAPVVHMSRLPALVPVISAGALAFRARWESLPPNSEVDLIAEMANLTADILVASLFGREVDPAAAARIVKSFSTYQNRVRSIEGLSLFRRLDRLPRFQGVHAMLAARRIRRDLDRMIETSLSADMSPPSLIRALATAESHGRPILDREGLRDEAAVLFLAGHETTANTLSWAFFLLSQDAETERRLHAELDAVLGDKAPGYDDLGSLPFTKAIVQETLRLYPPIPLQARTAANNTHIGQKPIDAGDIVILNAWILHRHRDIWADPDAFIPDRFMPGGAGPPSRYAYVPFGIGPRTCTGAAFGQTEAIICLATLARRFRLRPASDFVLDPVCRLTLRPGRRLPMRLHRRA